MTLKQFEKEIYKAIAKTNYSKRINYDDELARIFQYIIPEIPDKIIKTSINKYKYMKKEKKERRKTRTFYYS